MTPVGQFIFSKRTLRGMTQEQLANLLGVDPSYVSRIERGGKCPNSHHLLQAFVDSLSLSQEDANELFRAANASQRILRMPNASTPAGYEVVVKLISSLPNLTDTQLHFLDTAIDAIRSGACAPQSK